MVKGVKIVKRKEGSKDSMKMKLARKMHDTDLMRKQLDVMEATQKRTYFVQIAKMNGITEQEAMDLVFEDEDSQMYKGLETISQIYDLRRQGKYKSADDLIRQHKKDLKQFIAQESARTGKAIKMPEMD